MNQPINGPVGSAGGMQAGNAAQPNQGSQSQGGGPVRILVAKPGLDGHDRGAKVIARAFRDAGFEVIYTGLRQTPDQIAEAALQEDVQVVALSILSGAHNTLLPKTVEALRSRGMTDVMVIAGGVIPEADIPGLLQVGVAAVFTPGTPTTAAIQFVRERLLPAE
jgi:methylmalonyl-CoA mutase C-terminal domain/subunit